MKSRFAKTTGLLLIAILFLSNAYADYTKSKLRVLDGEGAAELIKEIRPFIDKVSHNGTLSLVNSKKHNPQYSIFLMDGFNVLIYGTNISIRFLTDMTRRFGL